MSLALKPYEALIRPVYEGYAAMGWATSTVLTPAMGLATGAPSTPFLAMTAISAVMAAMRAKEATDIWEQKIALCGHGFSFTRVSRIQALMKQNPEALWLGAGWDWKPNHTQRLYEVRKRDLDTILPPKWFMKRMGAHHLIDKPFVGQPWLHGLNEKENHVFIPLMAMEGHCLIFGTTGAGKAQPLDSKVHTPSGWKLMGNVKVGDRVSIPGGGDAVVRGIFPQGKIPIYRVTFADGRTAEACGEHLWEIYHKHWNGKYKPGVSRTGKAVPRILTTQQLKKQIASNKGKFSVRLSGFVEKPEAELPLDPYVLGAILGDGLIGKHNRMSFTCATPEIVDEINRRLPSTVELVKRPVKTGIEYTFRMTEGQQRLGWIKETNRTVHASHPLKDIIKNLGLSECRSWEKSIPALYKEGSVQQRLAMIQGLMDTDGTIGKNGNTTFDTTSEALAKDMQELIWSIGGLARIAVRENMTYIGSDGKKKKGRVAYRVNIRHPEPRLLFRAPTHKIERAARSNQYSDTLKLHVTKVEEIGTKEAQCIYIDHPDHLYITDSYVVTHNTRLYENIIVQAVLRGDTVVIIDPKGDAELAEIAKNACELAGRPDAYIEFNPAHSSRSIRLDPLRNWNNVTELASRIASLMPSEGNDSFVQMAWKAVYAVSEALVYVDQMPNLMKLRRYIEGGPEKLMEQALRAFYQRHVPHWESLIAPIMQRARDGKLQSKVIASPELLAYMHFYKNEIPEDRRAPELEGLMAMVEHNREHLGKILASLVPLLVMLTAGEIGKMLSPDQNDITDERPIFDTKKVCNGHHVLYLGLNSLSNATVGSAVGSMVLADFASVAGDRYNYGNGAKDKIHLLVDEAAEVVNNPLIQILNKARGAGFVTYLAAQTLPDFIARMGDEAKARQILGNCNNVVSLRVRDRMTQDFIVETFGETDIQKVSRGLSSGVRPDGDDVTKNTNITKTLQEETVEIFPADMLGKLPNLEYMGFFAGGRLVKGRLGKLVEG